MGEGNINWDEAKSADSRQLETLESLRISVDFMIDK